MQSQSCKILIRQTSVGTKKWPVHTSEVNFFQNWIQNSSMMAYLVSNNHCTKFCLELGVQSVIPVMPPNPNTFIKDMWHFCAEASFVSLIIFHSSTNEGCGAAWVRKMPAKSHRRQGLCSLWILFSLLLWGILLATGSSGECQTHSSENILKHHCYSKNSSFYCSFKHFFFVQLIRSLIFPPQRLLCLLYNKSTRI